MDNALHTAFKNKSYRKMSILIDLGMDPDKQDYSDSGKRGNDPGGHSCQEGRGLTILMKCCYIQDFTERTELVTRLLEKGVNTDLQDTSGRTALFHAVVNNRIKIVKLLLNNVDCDLNQKDHSGSTILHLAAEKGLYNIVRHLVTLYRTYHVDIDVTNTHGMTALHIACQRGQYDIARTLVYAGNASLTIRDNVHFHSPREWIAMVLELLDHVDPFPETASLRKKWALSSSVGMLQSIKERSDAKTAPPRRTRVQHDSAYSVHDSAHCDQHKNQNCANHITNNTVDSPRIGTYSKRAKSAHAIRNGTHISEYTSSQPRSKTSMMEIVRIKKSGNHILKKKISIIEEDQSRKQASSDYVRKPRMKSAPIILQSRRPINLNRNTMPNMVNPAHESTVNAVVMSSKKDLHEVENASKMSFIQTSTFRSIYELYTLQWSHSYRPSAIPPVPDVSIEIEPCDDDNQTARTTLRSSLSTNPTKSRIQRALRSRKADGIIKSLKSGVRSQGSVPPPSPRGERRQSGGMDKQTHSDPGPGTHGMSYESGGSSGGPSPRSPKDRRPSVRVNKSWDRASIGSVLDEVTNMAAGGSDASGSLSSSKDVFDS